MMHKISITISGHQTSFSIEDEFAKALKMLADGDGKTVAAIIREIDGERDADTNLSSAVRVAILKRLLKTAKSKS